MISRLDIDRIKENLRTESFGQSLFYFEKLGSTSDKLAELAKGGAPEGTAIVAETQTAGRGRDGNAWYSPPGLGLYLSVLLRPSLPAIRLSGLTLALGQAAALAVEQVSPAKVQLKWPNDLFCNGRKIGGLLTDNAGDFVVAGVGINANNELIPLELCDTASSIYLETGSGVYREDLTVKVLENMESHYLRFVEQGFDAFREQIEKRFYLTKRWVSVEAGSGRPVRGVATGLDSQGSLLIIDPEGQTVRVQSGTVTEIEP
jgi:BirA family biotin operon repressor/biotin-[acetyl-CoA-carboxylase] ligase